MSRNSYLRTALFIDAFALAVFLSGCSTHGYRPPQVSITQLETFTRPAKEPDCTMPVLYDEPRSRYRKIAIVEGWAGSIDQQEELLAAIKRKACETGADALLIIQQTSQTTNSLLDSGEIQSGEEEPAKRSGLDIATRRQMSDHFTQQGERAYRGYYIDAAATIYVTPK